MRSRSEVAVLLVCHVIMIAIASLLTGALIWLFLGAANYALHGTMPGFWCITRWVSAFYAVFGSTKIRLDHGVYYVSLFRIIGAVIRTLAGGQS